MNNSTEITIKLEREKPDVENTKTIFEEFDINKLLKETIDHINKMYGEVMKQSRKSFAWSLIFSIGGLVGVIALIFYYLIYSNITDWVVMLGGLASIILQIIGGTIFILHARSIKQIYYFGERMTKIYESLIANYIADGIQNETKRDETKSSVAIETAKRKLSEPQKIDED